MTDVVVILPATPERPVAGIRWTSTGRTVRAGPGSRVLDVMGLSRDVERAIVAEIGGLERTEAREIAAVLAAFSGSFRL